MNWRITRAACYCNERPHAHALQHVRYKHTHTHTQPKGMYEEDGHLLVRRLAFTCELTTARFLPLLYLVVPLTVCGLAFPHVGANSAVRFPLLCGKP